MKQQKKKFKILLIKKMQNKLIKIARDNELFLKKFVKAQKKTDLILYKFCQ